MRAATDEIRLVRHDNNGPAIGVSGITIIRESDSGVASIYTTRSGSTTIPQSSLTSDQDGYVVQPGGGAAFVDLDDYLVQAPGSRAIHWDVTGGAVNSVNGRVGDVTGLGEAEGVYVEQYLALAVDHDAGIEAAITAAAATGAGTPVVLGRIYDIDDLHVFDSNPPVGGPTTGFHATSASGGIRCGTALGTGLPRNLNKLARAGGFIFDGGGVSTVGVQTKTTNWRYDTMTIFGCASGTNALSIWGQNNHYDVWAVSTGTGFCVAFDNGAGGNRVRGKVNGTNFVLFDQTVTQSTDYYVPTDNILDGLISDQPAGLDPAVARYCILQRFGYENVIRDCNLYHGQALAGIKYERGAGGVVPAGHDWNGNLKLEGRNMLTCPATGSYAVWADFVSGGVAGQAGPFNNVLLSISGTVLVSGVDGDFKWGATNPCVFAGAYWPHSGTRPFWTTDGTGAAVRPVGPMVTDSKTGLGGLPTTSRFEIRGDDGAIRFPGDTGDVGPKLSRAATARLATDSDFSSDDRIIAQYGNANQVDVGNASGPFPGIYMGPYDTFFGRAAAGQFAVGSSGTATSLLITPHSGLPALKALVAAGQVAFAARQVAADPVLGNKLLDADAQRSFEILGDGKTSWGPGGSTAPDTNLYRAAPDSLKTDDKLTAALGLDAGSNKVTNVADGTVATDAASKGQVDAGNALWKPPYRVLMMAGGSSTTAAASGNKYMLCNSTATNITSFGAGIVVFWAYGIAAADLAVTGFTTKLRVKAAIKTGITAPAITITVGLYPLVDGAGETLGTLVTGSGVGIASPAANLLTPYSNSGDFTPPAADGNYALGYIVSGAPAGTFGVMAELQAHYV